MAVTYTKSQNGSKVVIHANSNSTIVVVGNNTVSNLTSNASEEVVNGVISKVMYGSPDGAYWTVGRGNSTVNSIASVYNGSNEVLYDAAGTTLAAAANGTNMYLTLVGSANGYIQIEMKKNV